MATPGRLWPHVAMATLTLLSVGAIVLSLVQAPPIGDTLLHTAAANAAGVPTVEVHEAIDQVVGGVSRPVDAVSEELDLPHGLELAQGSVLERLVDGHAYVSVDGGRTWYEDAAAHVDLASVATALRRPLEFLRRARRVVASSGEERFSFTTTGSRLIRALHLGIGARPDAGPVPVTATVAGEFVTSMTAQFSVRSQRYVFSISYGQFGTAPALAVPPVTGT
jgi:hypothetical protein